MGIMFMLIELYWDGVYELSSFFQFVTVVKLIFLSLNENNRLCTELGKISNWMSRNKVGNISSHNLKQ
jgi:hypothetical protein